ALEWSYDLLDAHEQALFTRLGVFVGGCTFEAAEAVCGVADCTMQPADCEARSWISDVQSALVDGLAALVDKSLLQQTETAYGEPRLAMLETIREYALERLQESGAMAEARKRHAQFFLRLAEQLQPKLHESEQRVRHETDLDNFRAALAWLAQQDDPQRAYRLWSALWPFWWTQGLLSEGRRWLVPLLARRQRLAIPDQSAILNNAGWLAYWQGDYMAARNCWEDVLALAYASGNMQVVAKMGIFLSMTAEAQGEYETARSSLEASLSFFRKAKDKNNIAVAQLLLGGLDRMANQTQQAAARFAESLALHRELGNTWHVGILEFNQGFLEQQLSNHARAGALLRASLAKMQDLGDHWGISHCLRGLAGVAAAQNQPEQAARLFGATEALLEITGLRLEPFEQSEHDQHIAVARAQLDKAAFAAAWAAGRTMPLEQAIAEALGH
ncbi:MAG TPA: tetratricopeptide repeat protein, partial [Roseiflexaceae bacterium]|nr:tetratricopeptide repeat protein [Roseiflexaceae bacterium]